MESSWLRALSDKAYEKRRVAALEIEKWVRETLSNKDHAKIVQAIGTLTELLHTSNNTNAKCGALMGLAAVAIALGYTHVPKYLNLLVNPILDAFNDKENSVRYFASESMYNCSKVARGEILIYFNEIFDTLSKLAADPDSLIHNGAELLDRLIKDIVSDQAATYVSTLAGPPPGNDAASETSISGPTAFSLDRFVPLLEERVTTRNAKTRGFLVSWLGTLDSIPEIELITYLPNFLDGLLNFLRDEHTEVRTATFNILAEFLREVRDIAEVQAERDAERAKRKERKAKRQSAEAEKEASSPAASSPTPQDETATSKSATPADTDASTAEASTPDSQGEDKSPSSEDANEDDEDYASDEGAGLGSWMPGQGVLVRHSEIVEILIQRMLDTDVDQSVQAVCLRWLGEFLHFAQPTILAFVPRLAPIVLSALSHPIPSLRQLAEALNDDLYRVIQELPTPVQQPTSPEERSTEQPSAPQGHTAQADKANKIPHLIERVSKMPTPVSQSEPEAEVPNEEPADPLDFQATVTALAILLGAEEEESRLAALHWLSMLHQKAPNRILSLEDGTFPALLKTLSDASEDVIRSDLQLLAQISSLGDEEYFNNFMVNLVRLFSTDRSLLDQRGRLIVGQLCTSLNADIIFRTFAKILEDEDDLEFASLMVQNLSLFLITLPELSEFRKRLRNVDQKDSQMLFTALYRSWSHNAAATLALCFLAGAYEHASNLLSVFGELEMTVPLLVQIDKLVQILESTAFIPLRLQLLEPDRYPFLLKALYGILMLLPQSTAFVTLRNRLNSVTALSYLHGAPRPSTSTHTSPSARSTLRRPDEIKWQEFLAHFRTTQQRHERSRQVHNPPNAPPYAFETEPSAFSGLTLNGTTPATTTTGKPAVGGSSSGASHPVSSRPPARRAFGAPASSTPSGFLNPSTGSSSNTTTNSRAVSSRGRGRLAAEQSPPSRARTPALPRKS